MRKHRLYAPFIKVGKRWQWATYTMTNEGVQKTYKFTPFKKETAVRVYQDWLLAYAMGNVEEVRELRPLTDKQWRDYWKERGDRIVNDNQGDGRMRRFVDDTHTDET